MPAAFFVQHCLNQFRLPDSICLNYYIHSSVVMRRLKRFGIYLLLSLLAMVLAAHFMLQYRAKQVLEGVVSELSNGQYRTEAKKVRFGYFPVGVSMQQFALKPTNTNQQQLSFTADSIELKIGSLWALLFNNKLYVKTIQIHRPSIIAYGQHKTDSTKKSVAQTIGAMQQKLFEAFNELNVRDALIEDAAIRINDARNASQYFSLNHIHILLQGLDVGKEAPVNAPLFTNGRITLRRPDIHLEDSSLQIQLGKLIVDGIKGDLEIDSLDISYRTPNDAAEKVQLNSIDVRNFNWNRFLQEGFFEVDSVLIDKGKATLDLTQNTVPATKNKVQQQRYEGSSFAIHYGAISNVSYALKTRDYVEKNDIAEMQLQGNKLSVKKLSVIKGRSPAIDIGALDIHISDFSESDSNSLYAASLSDLSIQSDALILKNYQIVEKKNKFRQSNSVIVPELRLEGYSLGDLLLRRIVAKKLTVVRPEIVYNLLQRPKQTSLQKKDINESVDVLLKKIDDRIQLDDIIIREAAIKMIPQERQQDELKLLGLSLRIDGQKALKAGNVMDIIHAIRQMETKGFTLMGKNILLTLSNVQMLNNPRGFYFGRINGQFGEDAQIDLRGVTLLNANNDIDVTSGEGLSPSHVTVESGTVTILSKSGKPATAQSSVLPEFSIGLLDLNKIVFKLQQDDRLAVSAAVDLKAAGFAFSNGIAHWKTLQIGSHTNELESGDTWFQAGSLQLDQPGKLRIKNAKGYNRKGNTAIQFSAALMEAGFGMYNTQPDELRLVSLYMQHPVLHISSTRTNSPQQVTVLPTVAKPRSKPFYLQHLELEDPEIDVVMKAATGDTLHYSKSLKGKLVGEDVSVLSSNNAPHIHASRIRYFSHDVQTAFSDRTFRPSGVLLAMSKVNVWPASKRMNGMVDTLLLNGLTQTIVGKQQDSIHVSIQEFGASHFFYTSTDSLDWKKMIAQQHWWMRGANITRHTATEKIALFGLNATNNNTLNFELDSMHMTPTLSREAFWLQQPFENDYISLSTGKIIGRDVAIDLYKPLPPLHIKWLSIDAASIWPQRDKTRPEDTLNYRPLLAQQILNLPYPIRMDSIRLSNGVVRYNEIAQKSGKEGKIFLDNVNGFIANVKNYDIQTDDSLIMIMNSRVYGKGQTKINFRQSYTDSLQGFWMRVRMGQMNMHEMNTLLRPQMGLQIKSGIIDTLTLLTNGNKYFAYGTMDLRYRKMSVKLLGKNGDGKFFLSETINWLANQLVRRHDNGRPNLVFKTRVVKRGQFNFLSKIGIEGILTNIGIKTDRKERKKFKKNLHKYKLPVNYWGNDDF